jgi:two-component system LytT family response regulator
MIRALLVDDEDIARERLRQLLSSIADLEVIGEAADGEEAIQKTVELQPDLLLLDIQMPGVSGLEVAACLPRPRPKIVFCTAFDTYAVKAFELHAVDYLLKPVSLHRLAQAIERIRRRAPNDADDDVDRLTRAVPGASARLLARCGGRYKVVPQREVLYFSSEGGLTRLHTRDRAHVLEPTLSDLEERLDAALFFRLSRATIVNLESVTEVRPLIGGTADVVLTNGATLEVSRRRVRELLERLGGRLNAPPPLIGSPPAASRPE